MKKLITAAAASAVLLLTGACGAPDEVAEVEAEAAMESGTEVDPATEAETATSEASAEDTIVICDEDGNRYASEEEAKAAGLDEAQYGATYCQYFE
ncbi:hypothetical protein K3162_03875 [Qipengyuania xiapuensis]|uniref:Lipoprotein n=1 Tax=Qipengyuania xiapuensis TaxID=2867236 RepID=A0ABX8ZZX3_9SPHN|nr:hypothetical protein [Qipengyuania xiapuensis]QZD93178.1 hypothetical protein K3162_03875 [Qipengyuania xiapuensis]